MTYVNVPRISVSVRKTRVSDSVLVLPSCPVLVRVAVTVKIGEAVETMVEMIVVCSVIGGYL